MCHLFKCLECIKGLTSLTVVKTVKVCHLYAKSLNLPFMLVDIEIIQCCRYLYDRRKQITSHQQYLFCG